MNYPPGSDARTSRQMRFDPRRRWPAAVMAAAVLAVFWQYFALDQALYAGDTAFVFLPLRHFAIRRLLAGELPLWNPHLFGGTPALAEAQYQLFYPPNLLLALLGVSRGMAWLAALHLAWLAAGAYRFARRCCRLERPGAVVAAVSFALGGVLQSRVANSPYPEAAAWLPWLLLAYEQARVRRGGARCLPGAVLALQMVTGAPQFAYYSLVLLTAWHLSRVRALAGSAEPETPVGRESRRSAWQAFAMTLLLGGGLAAGQILPQLELAPLSERGARASYEYTTAFSLNPGHFFGTLLIPWYWGTFNAPPTDGFFPGEELAYGGVVVPALALAAAVVGLRRNTCRGATALWVLVGIAAILLALGSNSPLYPLLYRFVPGIGMFRAPARWLLLYAFAASMLAGRGADLVLGAGPDAGSARRVAFGAAMAAVVIAALMLFGPWSGSAYTGPQLPGPTTQLILLAGSAALLGAMALCRPRPGAVLNGRAPALLLGLLVLDLFLLSQEMELQHTLDVRGLEDPPETVLRLKGSEGPFRFWAVDRVGPLERWQAAPGQQNLSAGAFRGNSAAFMNSLMLSCVPSQFGLDGLTGVWGALMPLARHAAPLHQPGLTAEAEQKWLRLLNVRYRLSINPLRHPELQTVYDQMPRIYEDPRALPRAFLVPESRRLASNQVMEAVALPAFDPTRMVLLETLPGEPPNPFGLGGDAVPPALIPATVSEYRPEHVRMEIDAPYAGYFVLMDTPYPGWTARVDGQPVRWRPANWVGRAVGVEAGHHSVEFHFQPASVRVGLFISLASLALCLGVAIRSKPHRRAPG